MFGRNRHFTGVEIVHHAGLDVGRADREPRRAAIDDRKIDRIRTANAAPTAHPTMPCSRARRCGRRTALCGSRPSPRAGWRVRWHVSCARYRHLDRECRFLERRCSEAVPATLPQQVLRGESRGCLMICGRRIGGVLTSLIGIVRRPPGGRCVERLRGEDVSYFLFLSIATRMKVAMMRADALMLPRRLPVTLDRPPLRRR